MRRLLDRLLGPAPAAPPLAESPFCQECGCLPTALDWLPAHDSESAGGDDNRRRRRGALRHLRTPVR